MTPPTYAEARAACVARYGEPPWHTSHGFSVSRWGTLFLRVQLVEHADDNDRPHLYLDVSGDRFTLAGEPTPDAPAATLPDALDAADAFLRTHATTATKGP